MPKLEVRFRGKVRKLKRQRRKKWLSAFLPTQQLNAPSPKKEQVAMSVSIV